MNFQGIKKGITEICDMILVNKAEDPNDPLANQTILEYASSTRYDLTATKRKPVRRVNTRFFNDSPIGSTCFWQNRPWTC